MSKGRNVLLIGVVVISTGVFGSAYAQDTRQAPQMGAGTVYTDANGDRSVNGVRCGLVWGSDTCRTAVSEQSPSSSEWQATEAKPPVAGVTVDADGSRSRGGVRCGLMWGYDTCAVQ
ncbi:hypothetical protein MHY1_02911 [Methylovirgula sp. HY1]|nr:hypothetical protein MHY1_02911 [Methylovirgula sp. HY1]